MTVDLANQPKRAFVWSLSLQPLQMTETRRMFHHSHSDSESEWNTFIPFPPSSHSIPNLSISCCDTTCPTVWKNLSASCKCPDYSPSLHLLSPPTHHLATLPYSPHPGDEQLRIQHQLYIITTIVLHNRTIIRNTVEKDGSRMNQGLSLQLGPVPNDTNFHDFMHNFHILYLQKKALRLFTFPFFSK